MLLRLGTSTTAVMKRINVNVEDDCHRLLTTVVAVLGIPANEFIYDVLASNLLKTALNNKEVQQIVLSLKFHDGSRAHLLQQQLRQSTEETH